MNYPLYQVTEVGGDDSFDESSHSEISDDMDTTSVSTEYSDISIK